MDKVLEIRVHGVSNTPPDAMLRDRDAEDVVPELVAGDAQTGFYRRRGAGDHADLVTEAYSWGQLTAGNRAKKDVQRAGWALLLPFALVNVALWARPGAGGSRRGEVAAYVVRLLALGLTATLTMSTVGVGMDQVGWQCRRGCDRTIPGTGFLYDGSWAEGLRPVAVGMLAPGLLLLMLWFLARRSFAYEAELPDSDAQAHNGSAAEPGASPFEDLSFWSGDGQVRRLAALHLAAALVTFAGLGVAAGMLVDHRLGSAAWVWLIGIIAAVLLGVSAVVVVVGLARGAVRDRASNGPARIVSAAFWCAVAGVPVTAAYLLIPARTGTRALIDGTLPGFAGAVNGLFVAQFLLVLLLAALAKNVSRLVVAVVVGLAGTAAAVLAYDRVVAWVGAGALFLCVVVIGVAVAAVSLVGGSDRNRLSTEPVWGGRSAALIAGAGWAIGSLYSAAALFWVADWLNGGATVTSSASAVEVPPALLWSAMGFVLFVVPLVVVVVVAARKLGAFGRAEVPGVIAEFQVLQGNPNYAHEERRARDVARWRAIHRIVGEQGLRWVGWLALVVVAFAIVGVAGTFTGKSPVELMNAWSVSGAVVAVVKWLTDVGSVLAGLLLLGLAALVGLAYRSPSPRKTLGTVWDIATFWPRGAHPFAPPSYGERAVPQLLTRICGIPDRAVILAGHSQGAILAVAAILQMRAEHRSRIFLLTYGTQLTRLYGRVFPAFFGRQARQRVAQLVRDGSGTPRWKSFYRLTDPMGWEIGDVSDVDVDVKVRDPDALAPCGGEILDPTVRQHSGYPCSEEYADVRRDAVVVLTTPAPSQVATVGQGSR